MSNSEEEVCGVCGFDRGAHEAGLNHQFNIAGDLVPKDNKPQAPKPANQGVVLGQLIGMLANKGILDPDDVGRLMSRD